MRKPKSRDELPKRRSYNNKRRIDPPGDAELKRMFEVVRYEGSSKHKRNPHLFGLPAFRGLRADETFCDETAGVRPDQMGEAVELLQQAVTAGLVGREMLWAVAETGWIFEFQVTNADQASYHGYPVLPSDPMAEVVCKTFSGWADEKGSEAQRRAAYACRIFYGIET